MYPYPKSFCRIMTMSALVLITAAISIIIIGEARGEAPPKGFKGPYKIFLDEKAIPATDTLKRAERKLKGLIKQAKANKVDKQKLDDLENSVDNLRNDIARIIKDIEDVRDENDEAYDGLDKELVRLKNLAMHLILTGEKLAADSKEVDAQVESNSRRISLLEGLDFGVGLVLSAQDIWSPGKSFKKQNTLFILAGGQLHFRKFRNLLYLTAQMGFNPLTINYSWNLSTSLERKFGKKMQLGLLFTHSEDMGNLEKGADKLTWSVGPIARLVTKYMDYFWSISFVLVGERGHPRKPDYDASILMLLGTAYHIL